MKHFIYDETFDGLLTTLFDAYLEKDELAISSTRFFSPHLMDTPIYITTCPTKSSRVTTSITTKLSPATLRSLYTLYLSDTPGVEVLMLKYLKLCYHYGLSINLAKNNSTIIAVDTLLRKVKLEAHRFYGLVRFKELGPLQYYARIEPDHNILPLITNHFTTRFADQCFIIHDIHRHVALIYNREESYLQRLTPEENTQLQSLSFTDDYEALFQTFYTHTTIKSRINPHLQKRMLPQRYWAHLVESPSS